MSAQPGQRRYVCYYCGHIYDEALGCPEEGIPAGTLWEAIPDDWVCPECGAAKAEFWLDEDA